MSFRLAGAAWKVQGIHPTSKLVLLCLADTASDDGECWPSYKTIADKCGLSRQSVISHIDKLCCARLLQKHRRKREDGSDTTSVLVISLPDYCYLPDRPAKLYPRVKSLDSPGQDSLHPPVKNFDTKNLSVEPTIEPNPPLSPQGEKSGKDKEDDYTIPAELDNEPFLDAWEEWKQHRKDIKKKLTATAAKKQLSMLAKNKADAVEIINVSIMNGYTGLFELKKIGGRQEPVLVHPPKWKGHR